MATIARYNKSVAFLRKIDPDWADLVARVGPCRHDPKAAREPYEALVRAIGYQQLTAKAGDAMIGRLKALHPDVAFPTPENILRSDFDALRACGFSAAKIATIKAIAAGALSGLVPTRGDAVGMDDEELVERITNIKGIGRWTVEMLLMYSLERMDILPVDDFGVRDGYRKLKNLAELPKPNKLREIGKAWTPHRTVASWYLWRIPRDREADLKRPAESKQVRPKIGLDAITARSPFRHMVTPGGFVMSVAMTNCRAAGWITDRSGYRYDALDPESGDRWPPMPESFRSLAAAAAEAAGYHDFMPDACLINRYEPGARLSLHQDKNERDFERPIVSVSLGLPATFQFGGLRPSEGMRCVMATSRSGAGPRVSAAMA